MTENRRIFLNIIATYGRSLLNLVCGLLTSRWVLNALGVTDYGLYGVVGCLIVFIGFFNSVLISGCIRFYAISIGRARVADDKSLALEECRRWFNTALVIELLFPLLLLSFGYPIGEWAVRHYLTIPPDRVSDCVWVFRCVCLSTFVAQLTCPFNAMYRAKQYIAELTIYSIVSTLLNVFFCGYMITHPRMWLLPYAVWTCVLSILPNVIIAWRARMLFPECRVVFRYMWDPPRMKTVLSFSGCILMGTFSYMLRVQGMSVLVNKFYGAAANTAMTIGASVNAHASTLAGALRESFAPAITTAYGAGDYRRANVLALRSCKFGLVLSLMFALPLSLEISEVLRLWLKNPPPFASGMCILMLVYYLADVCTEGHVTAVNAHGKIFWYNLILSAVGLCTLPLAALAAWFGGNLYWMAYVLIFMVALNSIGHLLFARHYVGMSIHYWCFRIMAPVGIITLASGVVGYVPHFVMGASFLRVCLTTAMSELVFLPLCWKLSFDDEEKRYVRERIAVFVKKIKE